MERMALSTSAESSMSTVHTWGWPMYTSAYGCWEVSCGRESRREQSDTSDSVSQTHHPPPLTSLRVGLPLKKSVFLLLFGGLNLGLRKAQPLAMASKGAGPSYGKDRPTNNCSGEEKPTTNRPISVCILGFLVDLEFSLLNWFAAPIISLSNCFLKNVYIPVWHVSLLITLL